MGLEGRSRPDYGGRRAFADSRLLSRSQSWNGSHLAPAAGVGDVACKCGSSWRPPSHTRALLVVPSSVCFSCSPAGGIAERGPAQDGAVLVRKQFLGSADWSGQYPTAPGFIVPFRSRVQPGRPLFVRRLDWTLFVYVPGFGVRVDEPLGTSGLLASVAYTFSFERLCGCHDSAIHRGPEHNRHHGVTRSASCAVCGGGCTIRRIAGLEPDRILVGNA